MQMAYQMTNPAIWSQFWALIEILVIAEVTGWLAERLLSTGFRSRGVALFAGFAGLYGGRWVMAATHWPTGPTVAGFSLAATLVGALVACAALKAVHLGVAASS